MLQGIARRAQNQLKIVYIDDCCKLRNKIRSIFGYNITVKLDLFHAIQRITKTLSKKHSHYQQCIRDLRFVFRCKGDYEISRLSNTPSIEVILKNMENFVTKWDEMTGEKLFKPQTIIAIENLKQHILTGCLSDSLPGGGTNRNKRLHEHINKYFNRSKIGILLAYSLLHMILYAHNSSKIINGKRIIRPIATTHLKSTCTPDSIKLSTPIGIMPKHSELLSKQDGCHQFEMDLSESTSDLSLLIPVYYNSLKKYQVMNSMIKDKLMQGASKIASFKEFKSCKVTENVIGTPKDRISVDEIEHYGLTIIPVPSDGNCFFTAVFMNIKLNPNLNFEAFGKTENVVTICTELRQAFVQEITPERHSI